MDAFRQEIRDTFLGVRQPPLTLDEARDKRFRMARRGYDVEQVDAFFDDAEQRLAAMAIVSSKTQTPTVMIAPAASQICNGPSHQCRDFVP